MALVSPSELLREADRLVQRDGRVALCQIVRTEGSTPGKPGWKMLVPLAGEARGNLGGGAFEALVIRDARSLLGERAPAAESRRYYLTESAVRGQPTGMVCGGLVEVFLEVLMAKPLLLVCGGGPVGQALAHNAVLCGLDVRIAEDREEFRAPELFPESAAVIPVGRDYRGDFLSGVERRQLFAAVVTRCWETDLAAVRGILRQRPPGLRYLGLMGSRRKVERVRDELAAAGVEPPAELRAPIGLPIGGDTPGEIAVSILAEIIQLRHAERAQAANEEAVTTLADS